MNFRLAYLIPLLTFAVYCGGFALQDAATMQTNLLNSLQQNQVGEQSNEAMADQFLRAYQGWRSTTPDPDTGSSSNTGQGIQRGPSSVQPKLPEPIKVTTLPKLQEDDRGRATTEMVQVARRNSVTRTKNKNDFALGSQGNNDFIPPAVHSEKSERVAQIRHMIQPMVQDVAVFEPQFSQTIRSPGAVTDQVFSQGALASVTQVPEPQRTAFEVHEDKQQPLDPIITPPNQPIKESLRTTPVLGQDQLPENAVDVLNEPLPVNSAGEDLIWWPQMVSGALVPELEPKTVTADDLLHLALANSPRIVAISQDPLIREMQVIETDADFDVDSFVRTLFEDRTDPVGNSLTTGGAPFLKDHIWSGELGFRRRLRTGGDLEVGQKFGFQNSNSRFFVPQDQGTTTLAINYTQPLLRGAGNYVNRAPIMIAQCASEVAWETFASEMQNEVQNVINSYWRLYFDRSVFLQKKRNVMRGEQVLNILVSREDLDSLPSQIARARSAVLSRQTELANALRDILDAETEIRRNIGEADWFNNQKTELLPGQHPVVVRFDIPLSDVVESALTHRPEIREVARRARIAALQTDISQNELLPELSLIFGAYVSALDGDTGVFRAWQQQFSNSTPGYSVGFEWELPIHRRAARSRLAQSKLQRRKLCAEIDEVTQQVIAETQIAWRRVKSALVTLEAAYSSVQAADADMRQQTARWETFALVEGDVGNGQTPTTILDQLLDAQERLAAAEMIYSQALLELQVAVVALHRSTGTLLMHEQVDYHKTQNGWVPKIMVQKNAAIQGQITSDEIIGMPETDESETGESAIAPANPADSK